MAKTRKPTARKRAGPAAAYAMPALSPLYPPPPFEYRDSWTQLIVFRSDPHVVAKHVPKPLVPDRDGKMLMMISHFFASGMGHYHEATLCAVAAFRRRPVNYALYLVLDNDVAIGCGREIWGFPKKLGRVLLGQTDDVVSATVERGGLQLIRAGVQVRDRVPASALTGTTDFVALKTIPSVTNGAPPEVNQLTLTSLTNFVPGEVYRGAGTLEFFPSPADRLHAFPVREVLEAFYYNYSFTLPDGVVIHDYLD